MKKNLFSVLVCLIGACSLLAQAQFDSIYFHIVQPSCHTFKGKLVIDSVPGSVGTLYFYTDSTNISNNPERNFNAGNHTVFISDAGGALDSIEVQIIDPPALDLVVKLSKNLIDPGDFVRIDAIINIDQAAIKKMNWRPPNMFNNDSVQLSQTIALTETTNIALEMVDTNNCTIRANDTVFVTRSNVFFPNIISAKGDINSYFTAYADEDVKQVNFMEIRDRWGKIMFEKQKFPPNDTSYSWNGRCNGKLVSQGTYLYQAEIEYQNGKKAIYKGEVTVVY